MEAYHASEVRTLLHGQRDTVAAEGFTVGQITSAISGARDSLDQGNAGSNADLDQGVVVDDSANIVPTDADGIAFGCTPLQVGFGCTPLQVAAIVYLSANAETGENSFFPNGIDTAGLDGDFEFLLGL